MKETEKSRNEEWYDEKYREVVEIKRSVKKCLQHEG